VIETCTERHLRKISNDHLQGKYDNIQLIPDTSQVCIRHTSTLSDNLPTPSRIIVNVNHTISTGSQASVHQLIVDRKFPLIDIAAWSVVDKILPAHRESKDIEFQVVGEMLHLADTIGAADRGERWCYT